MCVLFILGVTSIRCHFTVVSVGRNLILLQQISPQLGFYLRLQLQCACFCVFLLMCGPTKRLNIRPCSFIGLSLATDLDHTSWTPVKIFHYADQIAALVPDDTEKCYRVRFFKFVKGNRCWKSIQIRPLL